MSDFDIAEESTEESAPFELYEFIGTYKNYYLTSDSIAHTFQSSIYLPVAGLQRKSIKVSTHESGSSELSLDVAIGEQIVKDYGFQNTPPSLSLTIYRLQRSASGYSIIWKGLITAITINNEFATFKSPSKFGKMLGSNIPNVYIQPPCNNVLFDDLCKLSRAENSINTVVSTIINKSKITIPSLDSFVDGEFVGGEIAIASKNERRTIIEQDGTTLTVNYDFSKISIGLSIEVTAGCDHSYEGVQGCSKFSNQKNFGGCPFVPGETNNLFQSGI